VTKRAATRAIVVHCSATPPDRDIGAAEISAIHLQKGSGGIGYALVIRRTGSVELGHDLAAVGAHVRGRNSDTVGLCLVGGVDAKLMAECNFEPAQFAALAMWIRALRTVWPGAEVLGHRDLSPDRDGDGVVEPHEWLKQCPCFNVREWLAAGMPVLWPPVAGASRR
jgi:N-acetylmuramoyl-L-alanine amidase